MIKNNNGPTLRVSIDIPLKPEDAFNTIIDELKFSLERLGIKLDISKREILKENYQIGKITNWNPAKYINIEWSQASWQPDEIIKVEFFFEPIDNGTQIKLQHSQWGGLIGDGNEMIGWFASGIIAPFLTAMTFEALGDWITDRRTRRPSGAQSRAYYQNPIFHYPNFRVILSELDLTYNDYLLEVGCGGGVLLKEALQSGCKAVGIDHSVDMVKLASEANIEAVHEGRLKILEASAEQLPFPKEEFTCATMTGVLGFLSNPVVALAEIYRVLKKDSKFIALGSDPKMRGTPAAPEPIASRLHFYNDDELTTIAKKAGFANPRVIHRNLEKFAREAGIPEEALPLFAGSGTPFLIAIKEN